MWQSNGNMQKCTSRVNLLFAVMAEVCGLFLALLQIYHEYSLGLCSLVFFSFNLNWWFSFFLQFQGQSAKLQTTQQPAVSSSQSASSASSSSYTNARWSSSWNHRSYGCQVAPTGSLLEEVLNEKKMVNMNSKNMYLFVEDIS